MAFSTKSATVGSADHLDDLNRRIAAAVPVRCLSPRPNAYDQPLDTPPVALPPASRSCGPSAAFAVPVTASPPTLAARTPNRIVQYVELVMPIQAWKRLPQSLQLGLRGERELFEGLFR